MARSPHYKGNNEGGYGNPPVDHQFKGEPGPGRPTGSTSLESSLKKAFRKKVVRVDKDGKRTSIDVPEALAARALELGLKGTLAANIEARKLAEKYCSQEQQQELDLSKLTNAELYLYGYLANKLLGQSEDEDPFSSRVFAAIKKIIDKESRKEVEEYWNDIRKSGRSSRQARLPKSPEDDEEDDI